MEYMGQDILRKMLTQSRKKKPKIQCVGIELRIFHKCGRMSSLSTRSYHCSSLLDAELNLSLAGRGVVLVYLMGQGMLVRSTAKGAHIATLDPPLKTRLAGC